MAFPRAVAACDDNLEIPSAHRRGKLEVLARVGIAGRGHLERRIRDKPSPCGPGVEIRASLRRHRVAHVDSCRPDATRGIRLAAVELIVVPKARSRHRLLFAKVKRDPRLWRILAEPYAARCTCRRRACRRHWHGRHSRPVNGVYRTAFVVARLIEALRRGVDRRNKEVGHRVRHDKERHRAYDCILS